MVSEWAVRQDAVGERSVVKPAVIEAIEGVVLYPSRRAGKMGSP